TISDARKWCLSVLSLIYELHLLPRRRTDRGRRQARRALVACGAAIYPFCRHRHRRPGLVRYPGRDAVERRVSLFRIHDRRDRRWTVELAFPWRGIDLLAAGRVLPPRDGDVWRIDCSRFEKIGRNGENLDPCAGWTWNRHGHYDSHIPEVFPYVTFSTRPVNA